MVDVQKRLDEIVTAVEGARSMPMSASCVVNRAELLGMLEEVRAALPDSLAQARAVLGEREQVVGEAHREAERIVASAHAERGSLLSDTQLARQSQEQAHHILAEAKREAAEVKAEADHYVDSKLANFEVVLSKTIAAVDRGREKLLGRGSGVDEYGQPDAEAPERSTDPGELRRLADDYVDTKLASFEAVLGKTLEAVGRGRDKLLGRRPIDELPQSSVSGQEPSAHAGQSDADYVAALAGPATGGPELPGWQQGTGQDAYTQEHGSQRGGAYPGGDYREVNYPGGYPEGGFPAGDAGQAVPQQGGYAPHEVSYSATDGAWRPQDGYGGPDYGPEYGWQQPAPYPGYSQEGAGYPDQQTHDRLLPAESPIQGRPSSGGTGGLDETSFFDTSVIDVERLRELDPGH